jgi:hypothetical protein
MGTFPGEPAGIYLILHTRALTAALVPRRLFRCYFRALHPRHCKTFILLFRAAQRTSLVVVYGQISPWQQITQPFFVSSDKTNKVSGPLKRLRFWQGTWLESGPLNVKYRIISIGRAPSARCKFGTSADPINVDSHDQSSPAAKTSNIFERLLHLTPLQPTWLLLCSGEIGHHL